MKNLSEIRKELKEIIESYTKDQLINSVKFVSDKELKELVDKMTDNVLLEIEFNILLIKDENFINYVISEYGEDLLKEHIRDLRPLYLKYKGQLKESELKTLIGPDDPRWWKI